MTLQAYPDDPHACIREASRDIELYIKLLEGDGLTDGDLATAAHYIRVAARARRLARERIHRECKEQSETWRDAEMAARAKERAGRG